MEEQYMSASEYGAHNQWTDFMSVILLDEQCEKVCKERDITTETSNSGKCYPVSILREVSYLVLHRPR